MNLELKKVKTWARIRRSCMAFQIVNILYSASRYLATLPSQITKAKQDSWNYFFEVDGVKCQWHAL